MNIKFIVIFFFISVWSIVNTLVSLSICLPGSIPKELARARSLNSLLFILFTVALQITIVLIVAADRYHRHRLNANKLG